VIKQLPFITYEVISHFIACIHYRYITWS